MITIPRREIVEAYLSAIHTASHASFITFSEICIDDRFSMPERHNPMQYVFERQASSTKSFLRRLPAHVR